MADVSATAGASSLDEGESLVVPGDASARVVGFFIDSVIVSIGSLVLLTVLGLVHGTVIEVRTSGALADRVEIDAVRFSIDTGVVTLFAAAYFAGSWVRSGATIGQRSVGLRVLPAGEATRVSPIAATVRFLALGAPLWVIAGLVSGNARLAFWCLALIWYAVVLVSVTRGTSTTGIHDRIAGTIVVRHVTAFGSPTRRSNG